jgi:hypothetical protein
VGKTYRPYSLSMMMLTCASLFKNSWTRSAYTLSPSGLHKNSWRLAATKPGCSGEQESHALVASCAVD